jgi:hypothetical protein
VKAAHQALSQAQAHLDTLQASGTSETEPQAAQSAVAACEAEVSHWEQGRETSRALLNKAPCGRTFQPQPRYQGPARWAVTAYVPRLITSPSS